MICVRVNCRRARGYRPHTTVFLQHTLYAKWKAYILSSMGFRCSSVGSRPLTWPPPFPVHRIKKRSSCESFNHRWGSASSLVSVTHNQAQSSNDYPGILHDFTFIGSYTPNIESNFQAFVLQPQNHPASLNSNIQSLPLNRVAAQNETLKALFYTRKTTAYLQKSPLDGQIP